MKIITCYDSKTESYLNPLTYMTNADAIRAFSDEVKDSNSRLNKHPEDYSLILIGEFDQFSGKLTSCDHVILCNASEYKN